MILAIKQSLTSRPLVTAISRNCLLLASLLLFAGGVPSFASDQLLISTLLSRSTSYQLHEVILTGTVGQVVLQPPRFVEEAACTIHGAYSFVLTDETGWILVDVDGKCGSAPGPPVLVPVSTGEHIVLEGTVVVLTQGLTMDPVVKLQARSLRVRQLTN
jgi:hypothetical protein